MVNQLCSLTISVGVVYGMVAFLYTEGIQLTAAHSGGRYLTSPRRKCNAYGATTFIPRDSTFLTSLVFVHAGYLFSN